MSKQAFGYIFHLFERTPPPVFCLCHVNGSRVLNSLGWESEQLGDRAEELATRGVLAEGASVEIHRWAFLSLQMQSEASRNSLSSSPSPQTCA